MQLRGWIKVLMIMYMVSPKSKCHHITHTHTQIHAIIIKWLPNRMLLSPNNTHHDCEFESRWKNLRNYVHLFPVFLVRMKKKNTLKSIKVNSNPEGKKNNKKNQQQQWMYTASALLEGIPSNRCIWKHNRLYDFYNFFFFWALIWNTQNSDTTMFADTITHHHHKCKEQSIS